jgi:hypothetical protein
MRAFLVVASLLLCSVVGAQTTRLDTIRHFDVRPGAEYSAIWGYTAPDGREYAILGVNGAGGRPAGTSIIDITADLTPREASFIPGPPSMWREMKTFRQYAYVADYRSLSIAQ